MRDFTGIIPIYNAQFQPEIAPWWFPSYQKSLGIVGPTIGKHAFFSGCLGFHGDFNRGQFNFNAVSNGMDLDMGLKDRSK